MYSQARTIVLTCLVVGLLTACGGNQAPTLRVRVVVDGKERVFSEAQAVSISQFLQKEGIALGEFDRVNPDDFTLIADNMLVTVIRVQQKEECKEEDIPYDTQTLDNPDLPPGSTKLVQSGANGTVRQCFIVTYEDGVEKRRDSSTRTILQQPKPEVIYRGVDSSKIEPVAVTGTLAYINNGQARVIEGNSRADRALPTGCTLDGYVFALAPTGRQLLYSCKSGTDTGNATQPATAAPPGRFNELWVLLDVSDPQAKAIHLSQIFNVLTADWVPGQNPPMFSYSTFDPRPDQIPNYQAFNDLYVVKLEPKTGQLLSPKQIVKSGPQGAYSRFGTEFKWSPDGKNIAWAQSDGAGVVDQKAGTLKKLFDFRVYATTLSNNWVWTPSLSWSADSVLLLCSIHGQPLGDESPETSPVFDISVTQLAGLFAVPLVSQAGIWAAPQYSPLIDNGSGSAEGYIAYLQARDKIDSVSSEYDLVIVDRDGSNARTIFPGKDKVGLKPIDNRFGNLFNSDLVWSPDGRQVSVIYQGDIYLVDVESGHASKVTSIGNVTIGGAHDPQWVK